MHNFKKKFGQNFISDTNLLKAIVADGEICSEDEVLEIGAGAGALTKQLSLSAKKVISYEIDKELENCLNSLDLKNVKFIFKDALKEPMETIEENFKDKYKLVANLPYYITSPLIFKFLEQSKKIESLTIMVQKEVAERIVAKSGSKNYGILSIMCNFYCEPKITRIVGKQMFFPMPNVDSAVVTMKKKNDFADVDNKEFLNFIKKAFSMRRKTLANNLQGYKNFSKNEIAIRLKNFDINKRPEDFSLDEFISMFKLF